MIFSKPYSLCVLHKRTVNSERVNLETSIYPRANTPEGKRGKKFQYLSCNKVRICGLYGSHSFVVVLLVNHACCALKQHVFVIMSCGWFVFASQNARSFFREFAPNLSQGQITQVLSIFVRAWPKRELSRVFTVFSRSFHGLSF